LANVELQLGQDHNDIKESIDEYLQEKMDAFGGAVEERPSQRELEQERAKLKKSNALLRQHNQLLEEQLHEVSGLPYGQKITGN
jgi:hypothetical protein